MAVRDANLESALEHYLESEPGLSFLPSVNAARVMIGTAADCPPSVCAQWTRSGWRVVILAAVPRDDEEAHYRAAGAFADPLGMSLSGGALKRAVQLASTTTGGGEGTLTD